MEQYEINLNEWLNNPNIDENTKNELRQITDKEELKERFHKNLEFGTAGLRGILGAGTNRMNIYNIRIASQGFANYLLKNFDNPRASISYDSRHFSYEFAMETALVFAANGIKTYLFTEMRPTPQLSYAINLIGLSGGVMITASHNPPEYNGYKVYGSDGSQVVSPADTEIIEFVNNTKLENVKITTIEEATSNGMLLRELQNAVDKTFLKETLKLMQNPKALKKNDINVVYTPLHGVGIFSIKEVFKKARFKNLFLVEKETTPDSDFGDLKYPNPEEEAVFKRAIVLAKEKKADIVIATDPDADRVGICIPNDKGEYVHLTGNQIGILICEYILSSMHEKGSLTSKHGIITSIVSSKLTEEIAKNYGVQYAEVFTGFKHFGEQIRKWEKEYIQFVCGFEESFGYQIGAHVRDKDGISSSLILAEMTAYFKSSKGGKISLWEALNNIYKKYGFYTEDTTSITIKGLSGQEEIKNIMDSLRKSPPKILAGNKIIKEIDYLP
ncbi:MAG: phospho-sugar mutase, partial [Defluviitaleaceae bacterium]|nr:phospho-sugar mutase [Defluviitaleaceae bacterium]